MKSITRALALAGAGALTLAACGSAPEETAGGGSDSGGGAASDYKACMVSDAGGWDDKSFNESISDGTEGLFNGKGSSHYVNDADKPFYGVDAFGKEKNAEALPQWARIWIDGTIVSAIGALVGLVIAGFNFASYNGLIKL